MLATDPKAAPTTLPELAVYLHPFADLFRRCWSRQSLDRYITGLLTDLTHKTCDTMAAAVAGTSTERLQHFLTDADWDAGELDRWRVAQLRALFPECVADGCIDLRPESAPTSSTKRRQAPRAPAGPAAPSAGRAV